MGRGDHSEVVFESRTEVSRGRDSGQRQKQVRSPSNRTVLDEFKEHRESTGHVDCPSKVPGPTRSSEKAWLEAEFGIRSPPPVSRERFHTRGLLNPSPSLSPA